MSERSAIEWTDSTFNPWIGCTKVSPACDHCYAERDMSKRLKVVQWGAGQPRKRTSAANWKLPKRWNNTPFAQCGDCGWRGEVPKTDAGSRGACPACDEGALVSARRRVFCASLADWLDNEVPIEWFVDLLDLIRRTPKLDWLLLTKRIGNWQSRLNRAHASENVEGDLAAWIFDWMNGTPPPHVWIGATVINQAEADRDIPRLLRVPTRVRFLSIEPMLGPVDLNAVRYMQGSALTVGDEGGHEYTGSARQMLHWIICGGESGPHARPMHPDWVRSLRDQCAAAGVPWLFKQWGEWAPQTIDDMQGSAIDSRTQAALLPDGSRGGIGCTVMNHVGKKAAGRVLDGSKHSEFPD
ncbi:MAG: phage Gp37/Gp68 family protein [Sinimarinibacterium flocculans]|uniref:phage Gp37/Gp68 family protein n=1 Tax=Sinimarinibacterium flocculans TaxID=985250 RepID=UPI003C4896EC